jgi:hypothetical protein
MGAGYHHAIDHGGTAMTAARSTRSALTAALLGIAAACTTVETRTAGTGGADAGAGAGGGGAGGTGGASVDGGCPTTPVWAGLPCVEGTVCELDIGCGFAMVTCTDPAYGWQGPVVGCPLPK